MTTEEVYEYGTSPEAEALEARTHAFIAEVRPLFEKERGMHVMRIEGLHRNLILSRLAYYLQHKDKLPALEEKIQSFLGMKPWVVGVTIQVGTHVSDCFAPARHHDVLPKVNLALGKKALRSEEDQGFMIYQAGAMTHLGRADSMKIAQYNGQLRRRLGARYYQGPDLYSEDLW